jgi:hypothetical protein
MADDGIGRKLWGLLGLCTRMAAIGITVSREGPRRSKLLASDPGELLSGLVQAGWARCHAHTLNHLWSH